MNRNRLVYVVVWSFGGRSEIAGASTSKTQAKRIRDEVECRMLAMDETAGRVRIEPHSSGRCSSAFLTK